MGTATLTDEFHYTAITSRKTCVVQRSLQGADKGEVVGTISSGFSIRAQDTVDAKELEAMIGKVEALESERKEQQVTLGDCNKKLENVLEKVETLI